MVVADDELDAVQAAVLSEPRNSRQWTSASESSTLTPRIDRSPVGVDADGDQHGAGDDAAAVADLFVAGVEDHVAEGRPAGGSARPQLVVEQGGSAADLRAG